MSKRANSQASKWGQCVVYMSDGHDDKAPLCAAIWTRHVFLVCTFWSAGMALNQHCNVAQCSKCACKLSASYFTDCRTLLCLFRCFVRIHTAYRIACCSFDCTDSLMGLVQISYIHWRNPNMCYYRAILSVLDPPKKCEYLKDYSLDFEHAYMTTYLATWKACRY